MLTVLLWHSPSHFFRAITSERIVAFFAVWPLTKRKYKHHDKGQNSVKKVQNLDFGTSTHEQRYHIKRYGPYPASALSVCSFAQLHRQRIVCNLYWAINQMRLLYCLDLRPAIHSTFDASACFTERQWGPHCWIRFIYIKLIFPVCLSCSILYIYLPNCNYFDHLFSSSSHRELQSRHGSGSEFHQWRVEKDLVQCVGSIWYSGCDWRGSLWCCLVEVPPCSQGSS